MNIIFMGTPDFSVSALTALIEAGHNIQAVVTQPDKKKGRGEKLVYSPVKQAAIDAGITVYQPEKARDEAQKMVSYVEKYQPLFYIMDAEETKVTNEAKPLK